MYFFVFPFSVTSIRSPFAVNVRYGRTPMNVSTWGLSGVPVPQGLSDAVAVAAGYAHSLALRSNGTVVAWGSNEFGQAAVPPGLTNVAAISAGGSVAPADTVKYDRPGRFGYRWSDFSR